MPRTINITACAINGDSPGASWTLTYTETELDTGLPVADNYFWQGFASACGGTQILHRLRCDRYKENQYGSTVVGGGCWDALSNESAQFCPDDEAECEGYGGTWTGEDECPCVYEEEGGCRPSCCCPDGCDPGARPFSRSYGPVPWGAHNTPPGSGIECICCSAPFPGAGCQMLYQATG